MELIPSKYGLPFRNYNFRKNNGFKRKKTQQQKYNKTKHKQKNKQTNKQNNFHLHIHQTAEHQDINHMFPFNGSSLWPAENLLLLNIFT